MITVVVVLLMGAVAILAVRQWMMHLAIKEIAENLKAQTAVNELLSKRISINYEANSGLHGDYMKISTLITGAGGSITAAFREIKKVNLNLGSTNTRVHALETGLEKFVPQIKESLMKAHEKGVRNGARLNELETKQSPERYVDPQATQINYGGTD